MESLQTLIRIKDKELERLRQRMAVMTENRQKMARQIEKLDDALANEVSLAAELAQLGNFFGNFSEHIKQKRAKIEKDIEKLDQKIARLNDTIMEHFAELKKYDIAYERYKKKQQEQEKKREQEALDALAIQRHRYKHH